MSKRSLTPEFDLMNKPRKSAKKDKEKTFSVFQNNLKNLSDKGETVEESNPFDESIIPQTPSPPKKRPNFFSRLIKSSEKKSGSFAGDKRIRALQLDNRSISMVSSPSIMMTKRDPQPAIPLPSIPEEETPKKLNSLDDDYMKHIMANSEEKSVKDKTPEKKNDEIKDEKPLVQDIPPSPLVPIKEVAQEAPKLDPEIITHLKSTTNTLMQAIDTIKNINSSILDFRRALAEE